MLTELRDACFDVGLTRQGVVDGAPFQHLLPGARSGIVFGSDRRLWEAFEADLRAHPEHLRLERNPLEAYVRREVARIDPTPVGRRWVFCDSTEQVHLDFQGLALQAGLGWRSRLWLLIDQDVGPWMGLRAMLLTTEALRPTGPRTSPSPCEGCPAPCVSECPAGAVDQGIDWRKCATQHAFHATCDHACLSRGACPVGREWRYTALERAWHNDPAEGRAQMAEKLGVRDDVVRVPRVDWRKRLGQLLASLTPR